MTSKKTYNWAILGCGWIAEIFTKDLQLLENANLYATASRNLEKSKKFANDFGFDTAYGSYEEMVNDPKVDIVYIATPHSHHLEHSLLCLHAKKAVLCEKAFAINSKEVQQMIAASKANNVFLMEAFWTRFNPSFLKVLEVVNSKELGTLEMVKCDFMFDFPYDANHRLYNMDLGGGALLDIGVYPVFTALMTLGVPEEIIANAVFCETGADETIHMTFKYPKNKIAELSVSFRRTAFNDSEFYFENGAIRISRDLDRPLLYKNEKIDNRETETPKPIEEIFLDNGQGGTGYQLEAKHVMECLDKGLKESPMLPLSFSLDLIETLDRIREIAGIVYPKYD